MPKSSSQRSNKTFQQRFARKIKLKYELLGLSSRERDVKQSLDSLSNESYDVQEKINTELAKENSVLQRALTKVTEEKDLLKEAIKQRDNLCAGGGQEDGNFDDQVIDLIYKQIQQDDHANKECDTRHIDAEIKKL